MVCLLSVAIIYFRACYTDTSKRQKRVCRRLLSYILLYTLIDFFWGIVARFISSTPLPLNILSFLDLCGSGFVAYYLLVFSRVYMEDKKLVRVKIIAMIPWLVQVGLLIANFSTGIIYTITPDGRYVTGPLRIASFAIQFFYFALIFFYALISFGCAESDENSGKGSTILCASVVLILIGIFQVIFPNMPFYASAFMLVGQLIFVFAMLRDMETSKDRKMRELDKKQQDAIRAFVQEYVAVLRVSYDENLFEIVAVNPVFSGIIGKDNSGNFTDWINTTLVCRLCPEDVDYFIRAARKDEVLRNLDRHGRYSFNFRLMSGKNPVYYSISFIHSDCDETAVYVSVANVDREIRREQDRLNEISKAERRADEIRTGLEESKLALGALARSYRVMFVVDLENGLVGELFAGDESDGIDRNELSARTTIMSVVTSVCHQESFSSTKNFCELKTVADRLDRKDRIKHDAVTKRGTACTFSFFRLSSLADGKPEKVIFALSEDKNNG